MPTLLTRWLHGTDAQNVMEYALLTAFLSVGAFAGLAAIDGNVKRMYSSLRVAFVPGATTAGRIPVPAAAPGNTAKADETVIAATKPPRRAVVTAAHPGVTTSKGCQAVSAAQRPSTKRTTDDPSCPTPIHHQK